MINITKMQSRIESFKKLQNELSKQNKFILYNPKNDTIIVHNLISVSAEDIFTNHVYGESIEQIAKKLIHVTNDLMLSWEHVKNGTLPKECTKETLLAGLYSDIEINETINSFGQRMGMNTEDRSEKTLDRYMPQIIEHSHYKNLGVMFSYNFEHTRFPITVEQYNLLTKSMDINEFINEIIDNSRKKFGEELKNPHKLNGLSFTQDYYIFNLQKIIARSAILGSEVYFKELITMTGFSADRLYCYPFAEYQFALFDGLTDANLLLTRIGELRQVGNNTMQLELFEINPYNTCTVEFMIQNIGSEAKA